MALSWHQRQDNRNHEPTPVTFDQINQLLGVSPESLERMRQKVMGILANIERTWRAIGLEAAREEAPPVAVGTMGIPPQGNVTWPQTPRGRRLPQ